MVSTSRKTALNRAFNGSSQGHSGPQFQTCQPGPSSARPTWPSTETCICKMRLRIAWIPSGLEYGKAHMTGGLPVHRLASIVNAIAVTWVSYLENTTIAGRDWNFAALTDPTSGIVAGHSLHCR